MEILTTLSAGIAKAPCPVVAFHTAQVSTAWANEAHPSGHGRCWSPEFLINGLRLLLQTLVGIFRGAWHMRVVYPSFFGGLHSSYQLRGAEQQCLNFLSPPPSYQVFAAKHIAVYMYQLCDFNQIN